MEYETHLTERKNVRPLTLKKGVLWTLAGSVVWQGCNWLMLSVLAKLMDVAVVGQYALALAVSTPILTFTQLNLRGVQASDAKHRFHFNDCLGLRLLSSGIGLIVIWGVARAIYPRHTALLIFVLGIGQAIDTISDVHYGLFQHRERMDRVSVSMAIKGLLSIALFALGLILAHSLLCALLLSALASLIVVVSYDIPSAMILLRATSESPAQAHQAPYSLWMPRFNRNTLQILAALALPLGTATTITSLTNTVPRLLVTHYGGERQLGIFAVVSSLINLGSLVLLSVSVSMSSRLARYYACGEMRAFRALIAKYTALSAGIGLIGMVMTRFGWQQIIALLFKPEYAQHQGLILWFMIASALFYTSFPFGAALTAAHVYKPQVIVAVAAMLALVLIGVYAVPALGTLGAAIALAVAMLVRLVGLGLLLRRTLIGGRRDGF